jgi:hypothetical protein
VRSLKLPPDRLLWAVEEPDDHRHAATHTGTAKAGSATTTSPLAEEGRPQSGYGLSGVKGGERGDRASQSV